MNRKELITRMMILLLAGGSIGANAFLTNLNANAKENDINFEDYDFTNNEFYNMMLFHKTDIEKMLKYDNAYLARDGKDTYNFELKDFKKWNEEKLTSILNTAKDYIEAMENYRFDDAQKYGKLLVEDAKKSIVELAFIAEDNRYNTLTSSLEKRTGAEVIEENKKIIYLYPEVNGIVNEHIYAAVGKNNYSFNALSAIDLATYNRDGILRLDKSPVEFINNFLLAVFKPIYNPTLYNQSAYNIHWKGNNERRFIYKDYTTWFYDVGELEYYYVEGYKKAKEELGFDYNSYKIKVNNNINGFEIVNSDGVTEYIIKDDQDPAWIVLTDLGNIQGLSHATSPTELGTYDTAVNYSDSYETVEAFLNDEPVFKLNKLK